MLSIHKTYEEIYISTNNQNDFLEGFTAISQIIQQYVTDNMVSVGY